jgi:hypothetical protein
MRDERDIRYVPRTTVVLLLATLALQVLLHGSQTPATARARPLPEPPRAELVAALGFGDHITIAKLTMLWLQSFDNQAGISIPFAKLDYARLIAWLDVILEVDGLAQYPLLAASRIYAEVPDRARAGAMLDFVERAFLDDPDRRWPWLAHAVYVAKHRLHDPERALRYAAALATQATGPEVPEWARQMQIFVLEDIGEIEAAKVLLGGLLDSGRITDPHELWFLSQRLAELEAQAPAPR